MAHETTKIGEVVKHLCGWKSWSKPKTGKFSTEELKVLHWPPDLFCIAASLLRHSASYLTVANEWPLSRTEIECTGQNDLWCNEIDAIAQEYLVAINKKYTDAFYAELYGLGDLEKGITSHESDDNEADIDLPQNIFNHLSLKGAKLSPKTIPDQICSFWLTLRNNANMPLSNLSGGYAARQDAAASMPKDKQKVESVIDALGGLVAIADNTCAGIGIKSTEFEGFLGFAEVILATRDKMKLPATLCQVVRSRKAIVLPKQKTPQSGISLRSLSHHLSLVRGGEVAPHWTRLDIRSIPKFKHSLSLLLLPLPYEVTPRQFKQSNYQGKIKSPRQSKVGNFHFHPTEYELEDLKRLAESSVEAAISQVENIDGVILPEMSMHANDFNKFAFHIIYGMEKLFTDTGYPPAFVCGGVVESLAEARSNPEVEISTATTLSSRTDNLQCNYAKLYARKIDARGLAESSVSLEGLPNFSSEAILSSNQFKHHRWQIDRRQTRQYGLGAALPPDRVWEECTFVPRREMNFFVLNHKTIISTLICEDLAQADPIGDILRAVGPNLVICLLADGPQLDNRWSARHATTLTDDPGCSVLTLTSLGMTSLSRPFRSKDRTRVVGLWKDRELGVTPLELPIGASGLVLSLGLQEDVQEYTVDGRSCGKRGSNLLLTGIQPIFTDLPKKRNLKL